MPADALAYADDPEPGPLVQAQARDVLGEDTRLDGPDAGRLGRGDEGVQQRRTEAATLRRRVDVDADLHHPGVTLTRRDGRDRGPALHHAVGLRDEPVPGQASPVEALPRRCRRVEAGV